MKLVKLSLIAVITAGSMSVANAVALDEAIQNVDLSGMLRYRYEGISEKNSLKDKSTKDTIQLHGYKAQLKFTSDIADNFKATALFQYSNQDASFALNQPGLTPSNEALRDKVENNINTSKTFNIRDAYLTYTNYDTSFMFGRMEIGSIWTDDLLGTGLKIVNNSIENVTLAAYAFDNYNKDSDLGVIATKNDDDSIKSVSGKNIYGIAAIANFDPVAAELWVANMASWGTLYAVDFNVNLGDKDDFAYNIHAQYAGNNLKKDRKDLLKQATGDEVANGNFYAIEAGFEAFGLDFNIGYAGYGKKDKATINTIEDSGKLINYGEYAMKDYQTGAVGKKDFVFGTIGYTFEDVRFGVDIINGTNKIKNGDKTDKEKLFEVKPQLSYKYSDKLNFSAFYAYGKTKNYEGIEDCKKDEKLIRFEAKYTF
ncbi:major outer membrane protein [Campylobacter sp. RM12651]|uniref:major outer membrane protein n=1 Tax=Campylobacter sp. RM12651 TaxID=1660079 RepID=UPI001EFB8B23|nr:major outer membrane protein [Campylobacter sp. RM12651]ULO02645.1 Campylo_MOMP domain-containing protein [Campylobacter sp. RM12651]